MDTQCAKINRQKIGGEVHYLEGICDPPVFNCMGVRVYVIGHPARGRLKTGLLHR
jgi:hypothetical protein